MRKLFGVAVVVFIGLVLLTVAGTLFPEGSLLRDFSDAVQRFVDAIAEMMRVAVRGFA